MADDLTTLSRRLASDGPAPVTLVQGEERLLVDEAVRRVLAASVDDPTDAMAVTRVDMAESGTSAKEILAACRSLGLFASRQAVVVRAAEILDKRADDREALKAYVLQPDPATSLVLVATKLNGNHGLTRAIKKHGTVLTFGRMKPWQVPDWVMAESRRVGHPMDEGTARLVADLSGTDLHQLRLVIDQLSLYVGADNPITVGDAETLLASTRSHTVFELVDAVAEGRTVAAVRHLHAMMSQREPALRILAMLVRHFRMLWQAAEARAQGASVGDIRSRLKLHEFVAK
ncbi:MAG: DNA polymerase III subunit delta, partial [Myxococcota bacterium]|nr:DNA polymerase III subunit delta [Myxococcota bacterium]